MPTQFFTDWALWEKMTFVLAGAIVITFAFGFGKLWWKTRKNKRNTILDEEKRVKVDELKTNRFMTKVDEEDDIPFGVRAIESGIEVDGIWVSRSNTPLTMSLRSLQNSESSVKSSACSKGSDGSVSPGEVVLGDDSINGLPHPTFRQTRSSSEGVALGDHIPLAARLTSSKHRESAYKPEKGSTLRWSSYGDLPMHKDTLSQLEGSTSQKQTSYAPVLPDSEEEAVADYERSSGTDSDGTLSNNELNRASHQSSRPSSTAALKQESIKSQIRTSDESVDTAQMPSTAARFCMTVQSPPRPSATSYSLSDAALTPSPVVTQNKDTLPKDETEAPGETRRPLLSQGEPSNSKEPVFVPGTLHVNTAARKVNSGFEVLPAGTFDLPSAHNSLLNATTAASSSPATDQSKETRHPRRLQKKRRQSATGSKSSII